MQHVAETRLEDFLIHDSPRTIASHFRLGPYLVRKFEMKEVKSGNKSFRRRIWRSSLTRWYDNPEIQAVEQEWRWRLQIIFLYARNHWHQSTDWVDDWYCILRFLVAHITNTSLDSPECIRTSSYHITWKFCTIFIWFWQTLRLGVSGSEKYESTTQVTH